MLETAAMMTANNRVLRFMLTWLPGRAQAIFAGAREKTNDTRVLTEGPRQRVDDLADLIVGRAAPQRKARRGFDR